MSTSHHATALPVKGKHPKPKDICSGPGAPPEGPYLVAFLLVAHDALLLAFWPCGPSFPCILALWAFISLHFGLVGLHFLVFWPCGPSFPFILAFSGSASGVPPTSCQKWPVCPTSLQWIYQRRDRLHFAVFSLLGFHFLAFWPCGPLFPCILALWAFISLHFGFVGLHFLAFWPCGPSFPFILALWAFISFHFGLFGVSFWPPTWCQKWRVLPNVFTMDLSAP